MSVFRRASVLASIAILSTSAVGMTVAIRYFKIYLRKLPIYSAEHRELSTLPVETSNWVRVGTDHVETEEIEQSLGTKNYVTRVYVRKNADGSLPDARDPATPVLQFHAAYYTGMIDTVPHVPERCFVGGGMQIGEFEGDLPIPLDAGRWSEDLDKPAAVAEHVWRIRSSGGQYVRLPFEPDRLKLRTSKFLSQDKPLFAGYFFIANGRHIASAEGVRLLAFDLRDSYAYYMKVQFTSDRVRTGKELTEQAAELLNELMGDIMLCAPDWVDVMTGVYPPDNPKKLRASGDSAGGLDQTSDSRAKHNSPASGEGK